VSELAIPHGGPPWKADGCCPRSSERRGRQEPERWPNAVAATTACGRRTRKPALMGWSSGPRFRAGKPDHSWLSKTRGRLPHVLRTLRLVRPGLTEPPAMCCGEPPPSSRRPGWHPLRARRHQTSGRDYQARRRGERLGYGRPIIYRTMFSCIFLSLGAASRGPFFSSPQGARAWPKRLASLSTLAYLVSRMVKTDPHET